MLGAKTKHLGVLAVAAGILAAVGMLVLMTLVVKVKPARALPISSPIHYALAYVVDRHLLFMDFTDACTISPTGICYGGHTAFYFIDQAGSPIVAGEPIQSPAWSPDGRKIAFACKSNPAGGNDYEICTINGNWYLNRNYQPQLTRLTNNTWNDTDPTWSPDGSRIAFSSNRPGNYEIYTMRSDGTGVTRLTNNPDPDASPDWSPTGTKIAFTSLRHPPLVGAPGFDIYTMNTDGSGLKQLTSRPNPQCPCQTNDWPNWSPDGTQIAFASDRSGIETNDFEIYTMNSDGSGLKRLTFSPDLDISPTWSPNGSKIAFASTRGSPSGGVSKWGLYWTLSNGTLATKIYTYADGNPDSNYGATEPDWDPKPPNY
jgi:Tol biopolymer transport system component